MSSKTHVGVYLEGDEKSLRAALNAASKQVAELRAKTEVSTKAMHKNFGMVNDTVMRLGGILAATFGIRAIVNFSKESIKLAAAAEGVRNAFEKIGDSRRILEEIKIATRGVIEESDLMTLAIKARNFKIPLQDLAKYLEFATNRAITTGGSITELTNKIVEGLGRKAPKSLVALGISAADAKKAFSKEGLSGALELVNTELGRMGTVADTAQIRYDRFASTVKDLKQAWGEYLNQNTLIQKILENTTGVFKQLADPELNFWQKLMFSGKQYEAWLEGAASRHGPNTGMSVTAFEDLMKLGAGVKIPPPPPPTAIIGPYDELVKKIYEAAEQSRKMAEAWKIVHIEIAGANAGLPKTNISNLAMPGFGMKELPGVQRHMEEINLTLGKQAERVQELSNVFQDMFMNIDKGFKGMMESLIKNLEWYVAKVIAMQAALFAIKLITGIPFPANISNLKMPSFKPSYPGLMPGPQGSGGKMNIGLSGQFELKASTAVALVNRGNQLLASNT